MTGMKGTSRLSFSEKKKSGRDSPLCQTHECKRTAATLPHRVERTDMYTHLDLHKKICCRVKNPFSTWCWSRGNINLGRTLAYTVWVLCDGGRELQAQVSSQSDNLLSKNIKRHPQGRKTGSCTGTQEKLQTSVTENNLDYEVLAKETKNILKGENTGLRECI